MKTYKPLFAMTLLAATIQANAGVSQAEQADITQFLDRFHQNPQQVMDEVPVKENYQGQAATVVSKFSQEEIESKAYVTKKDQFKKSIVKTQKRVGYARAASQYNDNPARLVDSGYELIRNVHTMDQQNLHSAKLDEVPWSDDYWALYKGGLGARYADRGFWNSSDWNDYWTYTNQTKTPDSYVMAGNIDDLSPSEKYDLLVGDSGYSMTASNWNMGKSYYDRNGSVERWMGLCHGWAPAAYMLPRPKHSIVVKGANGEDIKFYPSDIKALGTLLWAEASPGVRFIGGRCNTKNPARDENGRVKDQKCFDTNPGSWHQSVVNQLGVSKRSFIIDATYDYQVWNQPVYSYSYTYFNPETGVAYDNAKDAMIAVENYSKDKFKKYRASNAKNVVGVRMRMSYVVETSPSHREYDDSRFDGITSVRYTYDLELDKNGNIIGGEWYTNKHPDFLWTPGPNDRAMSYVTGNGEWKEGESIPQNWRSQATWMSRYSQPLTSIVEELFKRASQ
ncbi:peptidase [Endozoicomonas sp. SM1973]|uniref:Peptidase n=1 Tax=Spartinivicinus marinus TaxID=2994442 RepID=A0A853I7J7_9GAMM|nr:peptidase [Spartinivicinus marinus]MCX4029060.1 hypothetical protein [Spartinivicinus marinus]NYZ68789.1 peptidase [Spartinivicinus marinus]